MQAALEAGQGKKVDSPLEPPEGTQAANTPILPHWDWFLNFWPPELQDNQFVLFQATENLSFATVALKTTRRTHWDILSLYNGRDHF